MEAGMEPACINRQFTSETRTRLGLASEEFLHLIYLISGFEIPSTSGYVKEVHLSPDLGVLFLLILFNGIFYILFSFCGQGIFIEFKGSFNQKYFYFIMVDLCGKFNQVSKKIFRGEGEKNEEYKFINNSFNNK